MQSVVRWEERVKMGMHGIARVVALGTVSVRAKSDLSRVFVSQPCRLPINAQPVCTCGVQCLWHPDEVCGLKAVTRGHRSLSRTMAQDMSWRAFAERATGQAQRIAQRARRVATTRVLSTVLDPCSHRELRAREAAV